MLFIDSKKAQRDVTIYGIDYHFLQDGHCPAPLVVGRKERNIKFPHLPSVLYLGYIRWFIMITLNHAS